MRRLLLNLFIFSLAACAQQSVVEQQSDLSIDSGRYITGKHKNRVHAVVAIQAQLPGKKKPLCSASVVSRNTLITAAHCAPIPGIETGNPQYEICIITTKFKENCTKKIYIPENYFGRTADRYGYDVALLEFDNSPFDMFFTVQQIAVTPDTPVMLTGYSPKNQTEENNGSKRWGTNSISKLNSREQDSIIANYGRSAEKVGVSPGDSGGPMFSSCNIVGVASRMSLRSFPKKSIHTNLTNANVSAWLSQKNQLPGINICGFPNTPSSSCPEDGRFRPELESEKVDFNGQPLYPCNAPNNTGASDIINLAFTKAVGSKINESFVFMSINKPGSFHGFCSLNAGNSCQPGNPDFHAMKVSNTYDGKSIMWFDEPMNFKGSQFIFVKGSANPAENVYRKIDLQ